MRIQEKENGAEQGTEHTVSEMCALLLQQLIQVGRKGQECQCVATDSQIERQIGNACSASYQLIAGCLGVQIEETGPHDQAGYAAAESGIRFAFLLAFSNQDLQTLLDTEKSQ